MVLGCIQVHVSSGDFRFIYRGGLSPRRSISLKLLCTEFSQKSQHKCINTYYQHVINKGTITGQGAGLCPLRPPFKLATDCDYLFCNDLIIIQFINFVRIKYFNYKICCKLLECRIDQFVIKLCVSVNFVIVWYYSQYCGSIIKSVCTYTTDVIMHPIGNANN